MIKYLAAEGIVVCHRPKVRVHVSACQGRHTTKQLIHDHQARSSCMLVVRIAFPAAFTTEHVAVTRPSINEK
jgi:hypothetical protein